MNNTSNYQRLNNIIGWAVFLIAAYVFLSTIEATASFWDCGEYIACSYKIEVGHPPGAPLFLLIARFFSLFAFGDTAKVGMMINSMSALCSAFTILFLFWSITALGRKIMEKSGELTTGKMYAIFGAGAVGALAYTFTDSFWFSAVEGEVYAMSSFFTAIVFWCILKWEREADDPHSDRWIILIAYLIGLSIGVHLLNLLAIPAIVFIYYFKKNDTITAKGLFLTSFLSIVILGGIQAGIIPLVVQLAGKIELFAVNSLGLPFNSGTILYAILMIGGILLGIRYTSRKIKPALNSTQFIIASTIYVILAAIGFLAGSFGLTILSSVVYIVCVFIYLPVKFNSVLNTIVLCFTVLLIGYSSFLVLVIRSQANPPMDENNPENAINLLSYLNRDQYGSWPILYGQYFSAPLDPQNQYNDGNPVYTQDEKTKKYIITDDRKNSIPNYDKRFCTIFPRMWSSQHNHVIGYKNWTNPKYYKHLNAIDPQTGEPTTIDKPTFGQNLEFFFKYQIGQMYMRYFFWNYVGRQNDIQGHGNNSDGNWITGIKAFDEFRLGTQVGLPDGSDNNKANNKFYALPLILGLIGMFYHFKKDNKNASVVAMLFFFTGVAIVIYLNQKPFEPRERDYAYAGSCYAFAFWIGLGVLAIYDFLEKRMNQTTSAFVATAACLLAVPTIMGKEGWDDHDRSKRTIARDFAADYLNSCAPNAVLFTNGDNDTFPLWYAQEVEGIRTDVRVICLELLNTDWYIDQMVHKAYDSDPVPFSLTRDQYRQGTRDIVLFHDYHETKVQGFIPVKELMDFVKMEDKDHKVQVAQETYYSFFPTKNMRVPVDSATVVNNGTVPKELANRIVKNIDWTVSGNYVQKNDLMIIDLLAQNNWKRPIYFAATAPASSYLNLAPYLQLEGLAYRLVPVKKNEQETQETRIATDIMYDKVMKFAWGGMDKPNIYLDDVFIRSCALNIRQRFGALANALIDEGKKDKAIKVLDKVVQVTPQENVPYDATMYSIVMGYYQAGGFEKANALAKKLFTNYESNIKYYYSLDRKDIGAYESEIEQAQDICERLIYFSNNFKQAELSKDFETRYKSMLQAYNMSSKMRERQ
jgi:MFS family permease